MSKKKAIKITTATAIAASAFVAVAPTQSEAATSSVDKAITKATNQMAKAYDTYHKTAKNEGKLPATGTIRNQVALAKDYYAAAEKEIAKNGGSKTKKAAYTKTLNAKKYFLDRAEAYLAAINTNLNPAKTTFKTAVEAGKAKTVVTAKAALVKDVDGFKATVAKIYGPDVRGLLLEKYATPATDLANSVNDELKVYDAYKKIEAGKFADLELTAKLIADVKPEADALKNKTTKLATTLAAVVAKNNAAYEAAKTPVVKEIKVTSDKTVEVTIEKARTDLTVKHFTVLVDGKEVTPTEVKSDAKGEVYTLTVAGLEGKDGKVSVNGKEAAFEFAAPEVKEVSAINAKQLEVTFNKEINKDSVIDTDGTLKASIVSVTVVSGLSGVIDGSSLATLSEDGKTLTITATSGGFDGKYVVKTVADSIKTAKGEFVPAFTSNVLNVEDKVRPTFKEVSYDAIGNATFSFSEPIDASAANIANALNVSGSVVINAEDITIADDEKSFTIALPVAMTTNTNYNFTFTGLKDFAGNLLSPNPLTVSVVKSSVETVKPTVTSVESAGVGKLKVTFSEKVQTAGASIKVGSSTATSAATLDESKTVLTFTDVALTAGVKNVEISGVKDLAGNTMDLITRLIEIKADTTAPAFVSQEIEKIGSDQFLVVKYDEVITVDNSKTITGTMVGSDNITRDIAGINGASITLGADDKSVKIKLPATAGDYSVNLPAGLVKDTVSPANLSVAKTVNFKLGNVVDTTKPVIASFGQLNNKVTVTFDRDVTAATALDVNNYLIEGVANPIEGAIFKGNARTVELTLKNDVITTTGLRNFTVKNIATANGAVITTDETARNFVETVRPTALSAKLIDTNKVEITFSETINDGLTPGNDINVYQGSTTALTEVSEVINGNKIVVTLSSGLTTLSGVTVKASSAIDLKDVNNNKINFTGVLNAN